MPCKFQWWFTALSLLYVVGNHCMSNICTSTFLLSIGFQCILEPSNCRRNACAAFSAQLQQPKLGQVSLQGLPSHVAVALGILGCLQFGRAFPGFMLKTTPALPTPVKSEGTKSWAVCCRTWLWSSSSSFQEIGRGTHRFTHDSHTHLICFLCFLSMAFEHSNHGSSSTPASNGVILPRVVCKLLSSEGV